MIWAITGSFFFFHLYIHTPKGVVEGLKDYQKTLKGRSLKFGIETVHFFFVLFFTYSYPSSQYEMGKRTVN